MQQPQFAVYKLLVLVFVFALLVCDSAACLASGLARSLALTAAAVLCTLAEVTSFKALNVFHIDFLLII